MNQVVALAAPSSRTTTVFLWELKRMLRIFHILFKGKMNSTASLTWWHNNALGYSVNVEDEFKVAKLGVIQEITRKCFRIEKNYERNIASSCLTGQEGLQYKDHSLLWLNIIIVLLSVSSVGRNMDSNNATPKRCPSEDEGDSFKTVVKEQNIS